MRAAVLLVLAAVTGCSGTATTNTVVGRKSDAGTHGGDGSIDLVDMAFDTTSCMGGGSDCQTGAPGACSAGIVTCDGTQAMCTMKSTVQACYDGPANTAGVGTCRTGTQSCDGPALGACAGQITPSTKEECGNDSDDDCNGILNDTCPAGPVSLTGAHDLAPEVGGNDSNIADDTDLRVQCPTNAFVTSVVIEFADPNFQIAGVRLGCSTVTVAHGTTGYTATRTDVSPSPYVSLMATSAVGTGTPVTLTCAGAGLRGIWSTKATYDQGGILGFFGKCGAATIAQNVDNTLSFTMAGTTGTSTGASADSGGYTGYDYGASQMISVTPQMWTCAANEVVVGLNGNVSPRGTTTDGNTISNLDNVQPTCATLSPTYR